MMPTPSDATPVTADEIVIALASRALSGIELTAAVIARRSGQDEAELTAMLATTLHTYWHVTAVAAAASVTGEVRIVPHADGTVTVEAAGPRVPRPSTN